LWTEWRKQRRGACFNIRGQTTIVTGANSGLGITFAEALAECGANVVLAARRIERLQELADALTRKHGTKAIPVRTQ
jgi:short-subunit dehydrogenase